MKPYGIIKPQQQMYQVYEVKVEQKMNPQMVVQSLKLCKPNYVKNEILLRDGEDAVHVVDKSYLPRRAVSLEKNQGRKYERKLIFNHENEQSQNSRQKSIRGVGHEENKQEELNESERLGQGSRQQGSRSGYRQQNSQRESKQCLQKSNEKKLVESKLIKQCFLNCGDVQRDEQQLLINDEGKDKDKGKRKPIFDFHPQFHEGEDNGQGRDSFGERDDLGRSKSKYSSCDSKIIRDRQRFVNKKPIFSKQNKILYEATIANEKKEDKRQTQGKLSYENHLNEVFIKNGEIYGQKKQGMNLRDSENDRTAKKKTSFPQRVEPNVNEVIMGQVNLQKQGGSSELYKSKQKIQRSFYERQNEGQVIKQPRNSIQQSQSRVQTNQNNQGGRPFKKIIGLKSAKCKRDNITNSKKSQGQHQEQINGVNGKREMQIGKGSDNFETPKIHKLKPSQSRQSLGSSQRSNTSGVSIEIFQITNLDAFTF